MRTRDGVPKEREAGQSREPRGLSPELLAILGRALFSWLQSLPLQTGREALGELRGHRGLRQFTGAPRNSALRLCVFPKPARRSIFLGRSSVGFTRFSKTQNPDSGLPKTR